MAIVTAHGHPMQNRIIGVGEFKTHCLRFIEEVATERTPLTITKRGIAVARLVPVGGVGPLFGALRGPVTASDDLIDPVAGPRESDR